MAPLLPSTPDTAAAEEPDPRVIGLDSDDADDLIDAISADTAREILSALHDEPDTPAEIADRVDTSLQNAQYHLENLTEAGLIEVIDTVYSSKGREMRVYAPADRPLVVFAGQESEAAGLRSAIKGLLGGTAVLAVLSALVQLLLADGPLRGQTEGADGAVAGGGGDAGAVTAETTAQAAASGPAVPPGVVFFVGGLVVLVAVVAVWYVRR